VNYKILDCRILQGVPREIIEKDRRKP
jgi:hypothetical protein